MRIHSPHAQRIHRQRWPLSGTWPSLPIAGISNVRKREAEIREQCNVGPVRSIQGMGLLLGLVCDRPAIEVRDRLLKQDILTGTSGDPNVLRLLPPLVLQAEHVTRLAGKLSDIGAMNKGNTK